ncbi:hypothetical protein LKI01_19520 [Companilactobacillus paralimentarius]|nr:hypothetical protein LKI01_19520 [Companilactobacillus paralimentarius]
MGVYGIMSNGKKITSNKVCHTYSLCDKYIRCFLKLYVCYLVNYIVTCSRKLRVK